VKGPESEDNRGMGEGYALLSIGITFALTITAFVLAGLWLDRRFGTTPLLTIVGTFTGMGVGGFWLYQRVIRDTNAPKR